MKLSLKLDLNTSEHSKNERLEMSKWLKLLAQHLEQNIDNNKFKESTGINQPICKKWGKKIGFYRVDKEVIEREMSEAEVTRELNEWSQQVFGYINERGEYCKDK